MVKNSKFADVTAIVTCYNQEEFIEQALNSIAGQSLLPTQLIIIDGCSTDNSVNVIREWIKAHSLNITFIAHEKNVGLCATMNQAMSLVNNKYVFTLYGDDWIEPDRIEIQLPLIQYSPETVCMVVGSIREVNSHGQKIVDHDFTNRILGAMADEPSARLTNLIQENCIPAPGVLLKAKHVLEIGGYDEDLTFEDYDMWMRLLSKFELIFDPRIVCNYRILNNSLSRNPARHGDFLLSEAKMIFKYAGNNPDLDQIICARIAPSSIKLIEMKDSSRFAVTVEMMSRLTTSKFLNFLAIHNTFSKFCVRFIPKFTSGKINKLI